MSARKIDLKIVARDENGDITRPTPLEQLSAVWRAGWEAFKAMPEEEQAQFVMVLAGHLQKNPAIAKALGVAMSASAPAPAPATSWAPVEYQVAVLDTDGNPIGRLIRRGNTAKDVGMQGFTKDRDQTLWNFDPEKSN